MRRNILTFLFFFLFMGYIFANSNWYKINSVDDFGDPTGLFYVESDFLFGTYKNQSTSSGELLYMLGISQSGTLAISLNEDWQSKNLTTTSNGLLSVNANEKYNVQLKYDNGEIESFTGRLEKNNEYKYTEIYVYKQHDFRYDFINNNTIKIVISGSNGMYNLGSIDTSGVTGDMFFDKTLYDEGVAMMKDGKYQDAISKFGELKSTDSESYDFYKAEDKLMESQEALVKFYLNSGEYQLALDKLEVCEKEFPNAYEKLEGRKVESEIRKKGNLYSVGCIVPSGGYVFYDKGYESDGWRYLEAAPADLRVVNGVPTVDSTAEGYSSASKGYVFGYNRSSASGNNTIVGTYTSLGMGKMNTQLLIDAMGDSAYSGSSKTGNYAARLCDILTYAIDGVTYDDWFLPSRDELNLMDTNLKQAGLGSFDDGWYWYWSSSEFDYNFAWTQLSSYGPNKENGRGDYCRIRPVRAF